jgi:hypothetical protein
MAGRPWKQEEIDYMKQNCNKGSEAIGKHLHRTSRAVRHMAWRYRVSLATPNCNMVKWEKWEDEIIAKNRNRPISKVHELLPHRTETAIAGRKSKLNLTTTNSPLKLIMQRQKKLHENLATQGGM